VGDFIEDVVTEDVATKLIASYRYSLKVGALVTEERELNLPVGFRHFQVSLIPVRNAAGRVHRLVELGHDITERKQAEAEIRASEERFRQMANTAPVRIWMTGPEGMISFYNQHALRFVNRTLEQLIGTAGMEFIHPDDRGDVQAAFTSAIVEHGHFEVTCRVQGSDGEYRWVLCGGVPRFEIDKISSVATLGRSLTSLILGALTINRLPDRKWRASACWRAGLPTTLTTC